MQADTLVSNVEGVSVDNTGNAGDLGKGNCGEEQEYQSQAAHGWMVTYFHNGDVQTHEWGRLTPLNGQRLLV